MILIFREVLCTTGVSIVRERTHAFGRLGKENLKELTSSPATREAVERVRHFDPNDIDAVFMGLSTLAWVRTVASSLNPSAYPAAAVQTGDAS